MNKEEESERKEKEENVITKWVQSYDKTQQNFYYFNPITRETTWEAPNDENAKIIKDESAVAEHKKRTLLASVSKEELEEIEREVRGKMGADDKNDNERLRDPSTSAAPQMMWEYEDDSGNWQGPFTMEQLQTWRAALPMNLKVRQCGNTNASEYTSLAILLGDVHLRKKCEELGAVLPLRCTAVEAEQVMMAAIAARDRIVKENLNGLASDHDNDDDAEEEGEGNENNNVATQNPNRWAQAALEGLPESDRLEQEKMTAENAMGGWKRTDCTKCKRPRRRIRTVRFCWYVQQSHRSRHRRGQRTSPTTSRRWSTRGCWRGVQKHWFRKLHRSGKNGRGDERDSKSETSKVIEGGNREKKSAEERDEEETRRQLAARRMG